MPHQTSAAARDLLRHQVSAAAATAALDGRHPGHWHLHHTALPDGPGDFTPYPAPGYAEHALWPTGAWLDAVAEILGPGHAQAIAQRAREAGQ